MCDEKCAAEALALLDAEEIRDLRKKAASNIAWLDGLSISTVEVLEAYLSLTDPETGELAILRSQNRDLQQAYDHVLECEQNRCREVVELQDRLAELRRRIDDAPVWYMENGGFVSEYAASFRTDKQRLTRVRLVRDDQPGEANA